MKDELKIDELLNSLIDGELAPRQATEVQRLVANDEQIAKRLQELQRCKELVGSLPCEEAPADMAEQVKYALERRTLLDQHMEDMPGLEGARHLLIRKVTAAAAMIGLFAVLAAVVYSIVAPERVAKRTIAVREIIQPTEKVQVAVTPTAESAAKVVEGLEFTGRLELKTNNFTAAAAFIDKAIDEHNVFEESSLQVKDKERVYALSCSRESLELLLEDLEDIWNKFDSTTLFVQADQFSDEVIVERVNTGQIVEIVDQTDTQGRLKVAKDFSVLNSIEKLSPGREILAAVDAKETISVSIPKPVLTSSEKMIKKPVSDTKDSQKVYLTIVIAGI